MQKRKEEREKNGDRRPRGRGRGRRPGFRGRRSKKSNFRYFRK